MITTLNGAGQRPLARIPVVRRHSVAEIGRSSDSYLCARTDAALTDPLWFYCCVHFDTFNEKFYSWSSPPPPDSLRAKLLLLSSLLL